MNASSLFPAFAVIVGIVVAVVGGDGDSVRSGDSLLICKVSRRLSKFTLRLDQMSGSYASSTTTTTTTTTADLSTSDQDEELNVGDDKRIIDERLRDANVNAVAVAINSLQNLTAAIQEIDLQNQQRIAAAHAKITITTNNSYDNTTDNSNVAKEYGTFVTPENGKSEEDTFNDLKEALAEAIKNAEKAKAKLEDVKIAANDVLKVRERIENYSESATYKECFLDILAKRQGSLE